MPGAYELTVWNQSYTYPKQTLIILGNEAKIYKFGHTPACPSGKCCEDMRGSLKINISAPKVVIAGSRGVTPDLEIYVIVQLAPNATEAIRNLKIELDCEPYRGCDCPRSQEKIIDCLKPGQTVVLKYNMTAYIDEDGCYFYLTAKIAGGTGVRSGFHYDSCSDYNSGQVPVSACRLTDVWFIKKISVERCRECEDACKKEGCEEITCIPLPGKDACYCACKTSAIPRCGIP